MKKMISHNLIHIVIVVVFVTLILNLCIQFSNAQKNMEKESKDLFAQIDRILEQNQADLEATKEDYASICLHYADAIAYILQQDPTLIYDVDELKKIAGFVEVDEIHIFDKNGVITHGTMPEYYDIAMEDGEQIGFFLPMLDDKNLRLCQDVTPNTAEGRQMQYAAVWSPDYKYIVQIGITPTRVLEVTSNNELSHVFSLLTTDPGYHLYAIDIETGRILGSTDSEILGKNVTEIGFNERNARHKKNGFFTTIQGEDVYCVVHIHDSVMVIRSCSHSTLFNHLGLSTLLVFLYLTVISTFIILAVTKYTNKHIVSAIQDINSDLSDITDGDLDKSIDVHNTPEFKELSSHINSMVDSILDTTDKMSYVLEQAELPIGVYEYSTKVPKVRATSEIAPILGLDDSNANKILSDSKLFEDILKELQKHPIDTFEHTYKLEGNPTKYIKMESFQKDDKLLGILIDFTDNVNRHMKVEKERDIDRLTGLYNRRALENKLDQLFDKPEVLGHSALIMLDADGLKQINDLYGHEAGDKYLNGIAALLSNISPKESIIARQGGDEFVIFYYGFPDNDQLMQYINNLKSNQDCNTILVSKEVEVPILFSMGYSLCYEKGSDYPTLLREADLKMYNEKKLRKSVR